MLDSLAAIQARIASIQSRFTAAPVGGAGGTAPSSAPAGDESFESQLAAALGTDGALETASPVAGQTTSPLAPLGINGLPPAMAKGLARARGTTVEAFVQEALGQTGDRYVFGASTSPSDPNPTTFDCSELVKWAAARQGVELPDGSWNQYLNAKQAGLELSVEQALQTRGALLFRFESDPAAGGRPRGAHVAISLGDGRTIEARGRRWGVGTWSAEGRFTHAALAPGLSY